MAVIHFCGATGKMFRGRVTETSEYEQCSEPEKPINDNTKEEFRWGVNCLKCPMRLQGVRDHNWQPYRLNGVAVTGPGVTRKTRQEIGARIRQRRQQH